MPAVAAKSRVAKAHQASGAPSARPSDALSAAAIGEAVAEHLVTSEDQLYGISELCEEFGISLRTIRFYEDKGLLNPKRINGTRVYTRKDRARLVLILRAKAIGSKLTEIKEYLDLYGMHGEGRKQQLQFVYKKTSSMIKQLEEKRMHLEVTLAQLTHINAQVKTVLDKDA